MLGKVIPEHSQKLMIKKSVSINKRNMHGHYIVHIYTYYIFDVRYVRGVILTMPLPPTEMADAPSGRNKQSCYWRVY